MAITGLPSTFVPSTAIASHTNFRELAKAKSRTLDALNSQVFLPFGLPFSAAFASSAVMMKTGFRVSFSAFVSLSRWVAVKTVSAFVSTPVAATM